MFDFDLGEDLELIASTAKSFATEELFPKLREHENARSVEAAVRAWMEEKSLTFKDYAQSARLALSGRTRTPGLFEVMAVLGKDLCVARLDRGVAQIEAVEAEG